MSNRCRVEVPQSLGIVKVGKSKREGRVSWVGKEVQCLKESICML